MRDMFQRASLSMSSVGVGAEVATIFHPRRSCAPSIVLSDDQRNHGTLTSPVQVVLDNSGCEQQSQQQQQQPQHQHQQQPQQQRQRQQQQRQQQQRQHSQQQQGCSVVSECADSGSSCRSLEAASGAGAAQGHMASAGTPAPVTNVRRRPKVLSACYASCCAESAKKIYFGVCVTICVTATWVGATHCIKYLYFHKAETPRYASTSANSTVTEVHPPHVVLPYNAPFFTTWFCTNWEVLYFPVYFLYRTTRTKCNAPSEIIAESLRGFRDKGFTVGRFLIRCSLFCGLWVVTNYMYIRSLRILLATDVMALFATNVSCVYLLSWVILHEQFVSIRIVAVILCNTGIALLAYMDGITGSPTLGGVVLATSAAAGSAVYKVLFKKVIGETTFGQMSLFFSLIGLCNAALLWPVCLALYFSGVESVHWARLPWAPLLAASILHLVANMLGNFSIALTYDLFITLGLITAVPVSAALDVVLYGAHFMGMKLGGMILIAVGFFLVMSPDNWWDYIREICRAPPTGPTVHQSQHPSQHHLLNDWMYVRKRGMSFGQQQHQQQLQHSARLRSYGVTSVHGDSQSLLSSSNNNNNNDENCNRNGNVEVNSTERMTVNSENQSRRILTSISKSTSTSTTTSTSTSTTMTTTTASNTVNHQPGRSLAAALSSHQDGVRDDGTECREDSQATSSITEPVT